MPPQMPLGCTQRRRDQHPSDGGHLTQLLRSRSPNHHRQSRHPAMTAWTEPHVCQLLRCLGHMPGRWWRIAPWTARSASWRGASCMGSCASAPSCDTSNRETAAAQLCPHASCPGTLATLSHIFITCPVAAQVLAWVCAIWAAITGEAAPPRSTDLFLADDRRTWTPAPALLP